MEGAHKKRGSRRARGAKFGARKLKQGYRSQAETLPGSGKGRKGGVQGKRGFQYHKTLQENPQLRSNPCPASCRSSKSNASMQRRQRPGAQRGIGAAAENTRKAAQKTAEKARQAAAFAVRHPAGVVIAIAAAASLYSSLCPAVLLRGQCFPAH